MMPETQMTEVGKGRAAAISPACTGIHRWLGYAAALTAVLLALSVGLVWYTGALDSSANRNTVESLGKIHAIVSEEGLTGASVPGLQAVAAELAAQPEWVAVVVSDPTGRVIAAVPETAVGAQLPCRRYWSDAQERPVLELWTYGQPSRTARLLGVTGGPEDVRVLSRHFYPEDGQTPVAYIWAIVEEPRFLGVTATRWVGILIPVSLILFVLGTLSLALWVFADARGHAMGAPWAWGTLTLVTNAVGWATYLVVRGLQRPRCPNCGGVLRPAFRVCPHCGLQLRRACPSCGQGVEPGWNFCPHCSAALN